MVMHLQTYLTRSAHLPIILGYLQKKGIERGLFASVITVDGMLCFYVDQLLSVFLCKYKEFFNSLTNFNDPQLLVSIPKTLGIGIQLAFYKANFFFI